MQGIVVYQSKFGNSRKVAEAIGEGLQLAGHQVTVEKAGSFKELDPELDFIVLGGPTRAARAYGPIKRLAKKLPGQAWSGKPFATFSTGASMYGKKPSVQASERLAEILRGKGLEPLAEPFKAGVEDMSGPLADGELDRALRFGEEAGAKLSGAG
jgi:flavodoxin